MNHGLPKSGVNSRVLAWGTFAALALGCASESPGVNPPVFSPATGTFTNSATIVLSSADPGAVIRYTTVPGLDDPKDWQVYSTPIELMPPDVSRPVPQTVRAIAMADGEASAVTEATFVVGYADDATPSFSLPGGAYSAPMTVSISSKVPSNLVSILLTDDGSPLGDWPDSMREYSGPLLLDKTTTISAMACNERACSPSVTATYTF